MWFDLTGDERITKRCATEGCAGQPTSRLEVGGVGSNYCSGCRAVIEDDFENDQAQEAEDEDEDGDCQLRHDGQCGAAGTEYCDFECPNRETDLFAGSAAYNRKHGIT